MNFLEEMKGKPPISRERKLDLGFYGEKRGKLNEEDEVKEEREG